MSIKSLLKSNTKFFYEQTVESRVQTIIKYLGLFHNMSSVEMPKKSNKTKGLVKIVS